MAKNKRAPLPGQIPLFLPKSSWLPPDLDTLPSWASAKRISVDIETRDPTLTTLGPGVRHGGYVIGVSFRIEDQGHAYYLPIRHAEGGNLDQKQVLAYLKDQAKVFKGEIVGHNLQYDLDYLAEIGIDFGTASFFRDTMIAEGLLDEFQSSYSLDRTAKRYDLAGKEEGLLQEAAAAHGYVGKEIKSNLWRLPAQYVGPYAEGDANIPLLLLRKQEHQLEDQDLFRVWDLESQLLPALVRMKRRGVRINVDRLDTIEIWANQERDDALKEVTFHTGVTTTAENLWTAEALERTLAGIGIHCSRTKAGKPSITRSFLEGMDHPAGAALARARKFDKLVTTFVASVRRFMVHGRIHCTYNQLRGEDDDENLRGAAWGRLSCQDPNLQQQPGRDEEIAKVWRAIYMPEEDTEWCSGDYSQQEPRWTTHLGVMLQIPGALAIAEMYRQDPALSFHKKVASIANVDYLKAKTVFLGMCYGMGPAKTCRQLGLPTAWVKRENGTGYEGAGEEGAAIIQKIKAAVPFVSKLAERCKLKAERTGWIKTVSGRRCRFPKRLDGSYDWGYKALNRVIQGSSGDQVKTAMVVADRAGLHLQIQVHDELGQSIWNRSQASLLSQIMCQCIPMQVPSLVDIEIGASWGESMK